MDGALDLTAKGRTEEESDSPNDLELAPAVARLLDQTIRVAGNRDLGEEVTPAPETLSDVRSEVRAPPHSAPSSPGSGCLSHGDATTPMRPEQRAFYPTSGTLLAALASNALKSASFSLNRFLPPVTTALETTADDIGINSSPAFFNMSLGGRSVTPPPDGEISYAYWQRRRRNNEAAKRSRDTRRAKEEEVGLRAALLEQENLKLRAQVAILKNETAKLHYMLYNAAG